MRVVLALIALGILGAGPVQAQDSRSAACGDLEAAEAALELFTGYFTADDPTGVRQALGIAALPADYPREVVSDPHACDRVFEAAVQLLGRTGGSAWKNRDDSDFAVYRFGPYYGILLVEPGDATVGTHRLRRSPLHLFRADGLEYVGGIMQ